MHGKLHTSAEICKKCLKNLWNNLTLRSSVTVRIAQWYNTETWGRSMQLPLLQLCVCMGLAWQTCWVFLRSEVGWVFARVRCQQKSYKPQRGLETDHLELGNGWRRPATCKWDLFTFCHVWDVRTWTQTSLLNCGQYKRCCSFSTTRLIPRQSVTSELWASQKN